MIHSGSLPNCLRDHGHTKANKTFWEIPNWAMGSGKETSSVGASAPSRWFLRSSVTQQWFLLVCHWLILSGSGLYRIHLRPNDNIGQLSRPFLKFSLFSARPGSVLSIEPAWDCLSRTQPRLRAHHLRQQTEALGLGSEGAVGGQSMVWQRHRPASLTSL